MLPAMPVSISSSRVRARVWVLLASLTAGVVSGGGCQTPGGVASTAHRRTPGGMLQALVTRMSGSFTSAEQAAADPEYRVILLHMTPIWPEVTARTGEHWLYVEQAAAGAEDKPYRQRVYRVRAYISGAIEPYLFLSEVYTLPGDPIAFAGAWKDPARLSALTPGGLTLRDGCGLVLREPWLDAMFDEKSKDSCFRGSTLGRGCPSDLRGAAYATSEAAIFADRLETWDQGFDATGKQVWGATKGPYVFKRLPDSGVGR